MILSQEVELKGCFTAGLHLRAEVRRGVRWRQKDTEGKVCMYLRLSTKNIWPLMKSDHWSLSDKDNKYYKYFKMPKIVYQEDLICKSGTKGRAYDFSHFSFSYCGSSVTHLLCIRLKNVIFFKCHFFVV